VGMIDRREADTIHGICIYTQIHIRYRDDRRATWWVKIEKKPFACIYEHKGSQQTRRQME